MAWLLGDWLVSRLAVLVDAVEETSEFETEQRVNPDPGAGWWGGQEDPSVGAVG